MKKDKPKIVKGLVAKNLEAIKAVAALPTLVKSPGGRPHKQDEATELALSDKDLEVLSVLMSTNGNKSLTARITGIDRKKLYRLLKDERVTRLVQFSKLRLAALVEGAVACMEKAILEDANPEMAYRLLRGLGVLQHRSPKDPGLPGKGKRATFEEWIDNDGEHKRQTLERLD